MTTASGLIFVAASMDNHLRAFDIETGKVLWKSALPASAQAVPMTYAINGKQYVVIQSGLNRHALAINAMTPELRDMRNQTMLFVFGL